MGSCIHWKGGKGLEEQQDNRTLLNQRIRAHLHAKKIPIRVAAAKAGIDEKRFYRLMDSKSIIRGYELEKICMVAELELDPVGLLCPQVPKI